MLEGVPKSAPALLRAQRLQERAARVSFDWDKAADVLKKVEEELGELKLAVSQNNRKFIEEEMGDLLFSMVNISRFFEISA